MSRVETKQQQKTEGDEYERRIEVEVATNYMAGTSRMVRTNSNKRVEQLKRQ